MRIGIVAGEASGDLLGAGLIRELKKRVPDLKCEGVAGPEMQAQGCTVLESSEALAVVGLIEPIRHIPRLLRLRKMLCKRWSEAPPDVVIGIDSPDFNLGLEERLRKSGVKTIHYVSPSVWAWRQGRIRKIRRAVDKVLCLLPFEKKFYDDNDVDAHFVGHPMAERFAATPDPVAARNKLGLQSRFVLAVLPGSRRSEVERLSPVFTEACRLLLANDQTSDISFVAPMSNSANRTIFESSVADSGIAETMVILDGDSETALTAADVALIASGTATLEASILATPMVVAYKVAPSTMAIARTFNLLKTDYVSLPNLLTDEPLVPEIIQEDATPEALYEALRDLLLDEERRRSITTTFSALRGQLAQGADRLAADAVMELVGRDG